MITLRQVNAELARQGIAAELVKGAGYFYFTGEAVQYAAEQGVYGVYRPNELSLAQWVQEARNRMQAI